MTDCTPPIGRDTPSAATGRSLDDIKTTGAAWIAESELARLVAIVEIVKQRRLRFFEDVGRSEEEKTLDALLDSFDA